MTIRIVFISVIINLSFAVDTIISDDTVIAYNDLIRQNEKTINELTENNNHLKSEMQRLQQKLITDQTKQNAIIKELKADKIQATKEKEELIQAVFPKLAQIEYLQAKIRSSKTSTEEALENMERDLQSKFSAFKQSKEKEIHGLHEAIDWAYDDKENMRRSFHQEKAKLKQSEYQIRQSECKVTQLINWIGVLMIIMLILIFIIISCLHHKRSKLSQIDVVEDIL